jgi:hypothetical protein
MMIRWRSLVMASFAMIALALVPGPVRGVDGPIELRFQDFYVDDFSVTFSDKTKELAGKPVIVRGFMAPPLRSDGNFLVLTKDPVQLCPYCETDADWPRDTLVVYLKEGRVQLGTRLRIAGTLELGSKTDPDTGFVSLIRLVNAQVVR